MDKVKMVLLNLFFKRLYIIIGLSCTLTVSAQMGASIYGKILDSLTLKPLPYVSVTICSQANDSMVQGNLTAENGEFLIKQITPGSYKLVASCIGFKKYTRDLQVSFNSFQVDVGNIMLAPSDNLLKESTVQAEREMIEFKYDKMIVNIDKDISTRGGTGIDALKNVPGITIDVDEKVSLRNGSPTVYIDGKPTNLSLNQIPADQILQIEVITTPSAKYEAAASGGIINILLKKNNKLGYDGLVNIGVGTNSQYIGMLQFNLKEKKWGFGISYNINGATNRMNVYTNRDNFNNGITSSSINQNISQIFTRSMHFGRVNFDYFINNRNTLSLSENIMIGVMNSEENIDIESIDSLHAISHSSRKNSQNFNFYNFTTSLSFKHTSPKPGREWSIDISYSYSPRSGNNNNSTTNYLSNGNIMPDNPVLQKSSTDGNGHLVTAQWDYTHPLGKKGIELNFGLRVNYSHQQSIQLIDLYNYQNLAYERDSVLSYNYIIDDFVSGAYITFSQNIKKFSYQIGLRMEQSYYSAQLPEKEQYFSYFYPSSAEKIYQMLFPSLNMTGKIDNFNTIQLNVTRKINRPNMFQNSPFIIFSDKYNYMVGNTQLLPEFINKAEIQYLYSKNKLSIISSVYGNYQENPITSYSYFLNDTSQTLVNTFANASYGVSYGFDNTIKFSKVKNLDITVNGNVFYTYLGSVNSTASGNNGWSWFVKANILYKFPLGINFQVNGAYEAPKVIAQGKTLPVYYFDVSLSREFDWLTVNFTVSDVLNSRIFGTVYDTDLYYQEQTRRRDTRFAKISLIMKFGKMDKSIFKKNKTDMLNNMPMDGF